LQNFEKVYVLDTNIILDDAQQLLTIGQNGKNLIVLPETVIDEIDLNKTGYAEINFQAREFARILSDSEVLECTKTGRNSDVTIMSLRINEIYVDIISFKEYDVTDVDRAIKNDRKIIQVAQFAKGYYKEEVVLLTNDVMCKLRAISMNVTATDQKRNVDALSHEFFKTVENFDPENFSIMENEEISQFVDDHKIENYCYHFKATDGNQKLGYIVNDRITLIQENQFCNFPVKPINSGQRFTMAGMIDHRIDVCIVEALAGSGKTLLAFSAGIGLVKDKFFDKIVYIRNSVESVDDAEKVGFLPGLESKFIIYNYPMYDTLDYISQNDPRMKKNQEDETAEEVIENLQRKYNIEAIWPGSIRGRTISNAFVIIDEVQNFSKSSLQTVISRLDKKCKVVCIGSNRQIDHPYVNKYTNGLNTLLQAAKEQNPEVTIFASELTKVVRGNITEWAERIFEKK